MATNDRPARCGDCIYYESGLCPRGEKGTTRNAEPCSEGIRTVYAR